MAVATERGVRYRWVVLGAGTVAQTSWSAIWFGIAVLAPALRDRYGLSLGETGALLAASLAGSTVSMIPWGILTDRAGERPVLATGLGACGISLLAAAEVRSYWALLVLILLSGLTGASVSAATGRAVMQWFPPTRRGFALGIRQTAIPLGGLLSALVLAHLTPPWGFRTLGIVCLVGAALGVALVREGPQLDEPGELAGGWRAMLERRLWLLSLGSGLLLTPQICLVGFAVLFLHDRRDMSAASAALVLAGIQLLGVALRITVGLWSDRAASRIVPLRQIALACVVLCLVTTALTTAPLAVLVPVLIVTGGLGMSWNSLSFTATAEMAGAARSGSALGFQQTILNTTAAVLPPAFGFIVGATGWTLGFGLVAVGPFAGYVLLRPLAHPT
jgi:sugar phosphate permease